MSAATAHRVWINHPLKANRNFVSRSIKVTLIIRLLAESGITVKTRIDGVTGGAVIVVRRGCFMGIGVRLYFAAYLCERTWVYLHG